MEKVPKNVIFGKSPEQKVPSIDLEKVCRYIEKLDLGLELSGSGELGGVIKKFLWGFESARESEKGLDRKQK